jgi:ribosomal-protein-alanine N-acetyltransferase
MGPVLLTEGGIEDLDAAMTVMNHAFNPLYGERWSAAQFGGALSLPGSRLFLAMKEEAAIGFALTRQLLDEAELLLLGVRPDWMRKGIGRQLLDLVIEKMRDQNVAFIHIEVRADNPAIEFYQRLDFVPIGTRRHYYRGIDGSLRDAITFKRQII